MQSQLAITMPKDEASRIIKRLTNHWRHKLTIDMDTTVDGETGDLIRFSDDNTCLLVAKHDQLFAKLTTQTGDDLTKLQGVVLSHLNRMANQEFDVTWEAQA